MASKFQFITELYSRTLIRLTGDYESWMGFLRAACYNYKCPFDEQVLIYAQRPNATAVLELEKWNRQFGRWVNAGATGIAVMDEARGKGRLKHYFDITDTHTTPASRAVPLWSMEETYTERVIETLEATFGTLVEKDTLPDAILSASRNAVADNMQDYLRDLLDCRGGSMLEELDALNVEVTYRRALQSSVAYMLLTRLSLPAAAYILPEDFEGIYSFDTPGTINALGIATSDIAEMGLREISRTVMQARRKQFFAKDAQISYDAVKEQNNAEKERSAEHGSDLQSAGGLSPAEPADAARAGDAPGQVRGAAEAVHQEAPQGAVYESQDQRSVGSASGGDRDGGGEDGDAAGGADGENRGRDGGTESRRSPALDGADEQPEAQRGGNGAERPDLQLNSTDENAGSAELPAFLDTYLIEAILLDDGGRKHTRQEIFAYFQTNRDIATRTEFLKNSYNDIWVEVLAGADKVRVGYHAEEDGLLMWEGSYLSRTAESVFSWGVVTEMTETLIERGAYKIKLGLQNAPVMAEQMSLFGMGGGTAVYGVPEEQRSEDLFPTRTVPQTVIDQTLYTAGNSRGSAERIAVFYTRQRPEAECVAFLRREFGTENGRGIEYEGQKYAVWFMEDGIRLAQGDSIRTGHCRTTVTWEQASARILELLEAGTYLSAPELEQAQDKVLLEMGDALLMTARDLAQEGRAQGLFPQTLAIHDQHKGYPELDEDMVAFAKSEGGLAVLAGEYHAFLSAYEQDHSMVLPVVEKEILWSKRCKDEKLRGTVKEIVHQISHSKKWKSDIPLTDEKGNPLLRKNGKPMFRASYSILQDELFNHMTERGFKGFQRGEYGSTAEHLTSLQYQIKQDKERLEKLQKRIQREQIKYEPARNVSKTYNEIDSMGQKTITGKMAISKEDYSQLTALAKEGITSRAEISELEQSANYYRQKYFDCANALERMKTKYNELKEKCRPFLQALEHFPEVAKLFNEKVKQLFSFKEAQERAEKEAREKERQERIKARRNKRGMER